MTRREIDSIQTEQTKARAGLSTQLPKAKSPQPRYCINISLTMADTIDTQSSHSVNGKSNGGAQQRPKPPPTPASSVICMAVVVLITIITYPSPLQPVGKPSLLHVWYYGWITAVSTGLGVLPLVFMPNLNSYWVGISNGEKMELCDFCIVG